MFDIGFFELALVAVVALLVVGPERLPMVARTAGLWMGKGRRFLASVKEDVDRELKAEELKKILHDQSQSNPLHEIREAVADTKQAFESIKSDAESLMQNPDSTTETSTDKTDDGSS